MTRAVPKYAIRAILCDAGGVLLHPNLDWISEAIAEHGVARTPQELHLAYYSFIRDLDAENQVDLSGVTLHSIEMRAWTMSRLLAGAQVEPGQVASMAMPLAERAAREFPREGDIWHWAMPWVGEQLRTLKNAGFRLGVASNNDGSLAAQLCNVGLTEMFEVALDSGIEGTAKPDPQLLLRSARAMQVAPSDCLYVGDVDRVDGAAARAAGMHFLLLDPLPQPRVTTSTVIPRLDAVLWHFEAM